ncbi:MAG TPA: ABC-F family ATP-binding cassette domain-containing protein [Polyangiaceae bacterium]|nr:ABC-F family ATP-binding cassette domain-containing protein [Polyangiaceae bacterium]
MSLLEVADLEFGYSNEPLFSKVTFRLEAGERVALVAPNGAGKSTLLRVITGELAADKGSVVIRKPTTLGYYRQSHESQKTGSVLEVLMSGFGELLEVRQALTAAQHKAASGSKADLDHLAHISDRYHQMGADRLEQRVEAIATRLGFRPADLERDVTTLSGGERGRLALGAVLATEADVLLLDEPTNHLDLESIRWLEEHLSAYRGGILVVSHDRAFLDNVCPNTMELGRTNFRVYPLPYTLYHQERAVDLEREREKAEEQAAFVSKTEDFIRKNMAGQKTKQAQSRRKMLDKLERVERPEDVWARAERVRFRFAEVPRSGDIVLEAKGLAAERGGVRLFSGFDLLVRRGDRIGIVGKNGSGKSTLMKLLAGRGDAADRGDVRRGTNLKDGYFDQHLGSLDPKRTAVEEIRSVRGDLNVDGARQYLARFRFYGEDPLRKVSSFSGGEHTRLALAKLLLEPRNLLFLDEPTNHLDIPAAEILEEALTGFEGTVILVSHDRRFLETVTTRTVAFLPEGIDLYEGGFKDYTDALERIRRAKEQPPRRAEVRAAAPPATPNSGDGHRARRNAARELERKQKRVQELEAAIAEAESKVQAQRDQAKTETDNWEKLHELARQEQQLSQRLSQLTAEWVKLSEELEAEGRAG